MKKQTIYLYMPALLLFAAFINIGIPEKTVAQTYHYDVSLLGQNIGEVTAVRHTSQNKTTYTITSKVQVRLLPGGNVNTLISATYNDNVLTYASASRETGRDNKNKDATTVRTKDGYQITQNGKQTKLPEESIHYSVSRLFFMEPVRITRVFSETLGVLLKLKSAGEHEYELQMPDGNSNIYTYQNGKLISVEVQRSLGKVYFKLKD